MALAESLENQAGAEERRAAASEELARRLDQEAATLGARLDGAIAALGDHVWRGPAADRTRQALRQGQARLHVAAGELRQVAALLRRRAAEDGAEAGQLRRRAAEARAATATPV